MIKRVYDNIGSFFHPKEVLILYGPRREGKTTLLENFLNDTSLKYRFDTGDNIRTQDILSSQDLNRIKEYAEGYDLLVIDEAQMIPTVGNGLSLIMVTIPGLRV